MTPCIEPAEEYSELMTWTEISLSVICFKALIKTAFISYTLLMS